MPYITQKAPNKKLVLIGILGFIVLITAAIIFTLSQYIMQEKLSLKEPMVLLLVGTDRYQVQQNLKPGSKNPIQCDTIILSLIDPTKHRISLVSIPKDTLVNIPGYSLDRISNAGVLGGENLLKKAVTQLTGIPIERYAVINMEGLVKTVDLLGGVQVTLPKEMIIKDNLGNTINTLPAGISVLDGKSALEYVKFNNVLPEDLNRLERQRNLLFSLGRKLREPKNISNIPKMVELKQKYIQTDLTSKELMQLLTFTQQIKSGKGFLSTTLPGSLFQGYWQPEPLKVDRLMRQIKPAEPQNNGGIQID